MRPVKVLAAYLVEIGAVTKSLLTVISRLFGGGIPMIFLGGPSFYRVSSKISVKSSGKWGK